MGQPPAHTASSAHSSAVHSSPIVSSSPEAPAPEEPAIKRLLPQDHKPHHSDPEKVEHVDPLDAPVQPSALNRVRGRLLVQQPIPDARSASAPNLHSPGHLLEVGAIKRTSSQISLNSPTTPIGGPSGQGRSPVVKSILAPAKPLGKEPGWRSSLKSTVRHSWLNVLLVLVPIAWAMEWSHQSSTVIFCTSFLAIIPLAALLGFATEELAMRVGDALGGLLNATFGNAVELIVTILALVKGELRVVQSAMLGSILSNCLLVLGCCFFVGGLRFHEMGFGTRNAQNNINMLGISVSAIVIPVGFHTFQSVAETGQAVDQTDADVLVLSRGIAIILLFVYGAYLTFQFWTHAYLYRPAGPDDPPQAVIVLEGPQPPAEGPVFRIPSWGSSSSGSTHAPSDDGESGIVGHDNKGHGDENQPKLTIWFSLALLLVITALTGVTAEFLVSSIDGLTESTGVSREFVALILLPLVGNTAEHVTAVVVAAKNKLDLSLAVAIGSSIQIALFVVPFLVILGWIIGQPLSLFFDPFETLMLFLAICAVNWAIAGQSRTDWLEGFVLMMFYVIIAFAAWYWPGAV